MQSFKSANKEGSKVKKKSWRKNSWTSQVRDLIMRKGLNLTMYNQDSKALKSHDSKFSNEWQM